MTIKFLPTNDVNLAIYGKIIARDKHRTTMFVTMVDGQNGPNNTGLFSTLVGKPFTVENNRVKFVK